MSLQPILSTILEGANTTARVTCAASAFAHGLLVFELAIRTTTDVAKYFGWDGTSPAATDAMKAVRSLVPKCARKELRSILRPFEKKTYKELIISSVATFALSLYGAQLTKYALGKAPAYFSTAKNWMGPAANFDASSFQHPMIPTLKGVVEWIKPILDAARAKVGL